MQGIGRLVLTLALVVPAMAQAPSVNNGGVVNAASFAPGQAVTPGSLIAIFGSNLASGLSQASSVPLSTSLGNVQSVSFGDIPAPLIFVSGGQVNAQLPWEVANSGTATVVVKTSTGSSSPTSVQLSSVSPGIFSVNFGVGQAIAINLDGTLAATPGSVSGLTTHPAKIGDTIIILCTGLGAVNNPVPTGAAPSGGGSTTLTDPGVLFGGVAAQQPLPFSGLAPEFPGVYQLNVVIPSGVTPGDAVPLQLQVGGITTTNQVTMAISSN